MGLLWVFSLSNWAKKYNHADILLRLLKCRPQKLTFRTFDTFFYIGISLKNIFLNIDHILFDPSLDTGVIIEVVGFFLPNSSIFDASKFEIFKLWMIVRCFSPYHVNKKPIQQ